ncbi:ribonuclease H, partial [Striga asiatica]
MSEASGCCSAVRHLDIVLPSAESTRLTLCQLLPEQRSKVKNFYRLEHVSDMLYQMSLVTSGKDPCSAIVHLDSLYLRCLAFMKKDFKRPHVKDVRNQPGCSWSESQRKILQRTRAIPLRIKGIGLIDPRFRDENQ